MLFQNRACRQREERVRVHCNGQVYFVTCLQFNVGDVQDEPLPQLRPFSEDRMIDA